MVTCLLQNYKKKKNMVHFESDSLSHDSSKLLVIIYSDVSSEVPEEKIKTDEHEAVVDV